jgi:hypothetical protein
MQLLKLAKAKDRRALVAQPVLACRFPAFRVPAPSVTNALNH